MSKKDNILDFKCVKIQNEIDLFVRTNLLPMSLKSGEISVRDIESCMPEMATSFKNSANQLIAAFLASHKENAIPQSIKDYKSIYNSLKTRSTRFIFASVLDNYRANVNPLSALYYECRKVKRTFNPKNPYHTWMILTIQDREFAKDIEEALEHDLNILQKFINRYYWTFLHLDTEMPIEVYHAKQLMEDFTDYKTFFAEIQNWSPPS